MAGQESRAELVSAPFTPGPWHVRPVTFRDSIAEEWTIIASNLYVGEVRAQHPSTYLTVTREIRSEADARLIAAAPDLLAALDVLWNFAEQALPERELNESRLEYEQRIAPYEAALAAGEAAIRKARGQ